MPTICVGNAHVIAPNLMLRLSARLVRWVRCSRSTTCQLHGFVLTRRRTLDFTVQEQQQRQKHVWLWKETLSLFTTNA